MKIEKNFDRKNKRRHHKYFYAVSDDQKTHWWVYTTDGTIDGASRRIYTDLVEEVSTEGRIPVSEVPEEIKEFIKKEWENDERK